MFLSLPAARVNVFIKDQMTRQLDKGKKGRGKTASAPYLSNMVSHLGSKWLQQNPGTVGILVWYYTTKDDCNNPVVLCVVQTSKSEGYPRSDFVKDMLKDQSKNHDIDRKSNYEDRGKNTHLDQYTRSEHKM